MNIANNEMIVSFPPDRIVRMPVPKNAEEIIKKTQKNHINRLVEDQANLLASRLSMSGVDISSEDFQRQFALSIECLRASIYGTVGLTHPMQKPMAEMIKEIEIVIQGKD